MKKLITIFIIAIVMGLSLEAMGTVTIYNNKANFLSAAPGPLGMESFEGLLVDNTQATNRSDLIVNSFKLHGVPYYSDAGLSVWNTSYSGQHATNGTKYVSVASISNLDFCLCTPCKAFGLYITDWGDFGTGTLCYSINGQTASQIAVSPLPNGNELFFGIISTQSFNKITLFNNINGESYGIDEVYHCCIPEPVSAQLMIFGLILALKHRKSLFAK
jgi:hypothetical protein